MDFSSPFNTNTRLPPPEAYPAHCAHLSGSLTVEMTVDFRTPQTNTCTTFKHFATFPLCVFLLYAFLLFCMYFSCCIHSSFLLLILAVILFILLHHAVTVEHLQFQCICTVTIKGVFIRFKVDFTVGSIFRVCILRRPYFKVS